MNTEELSDSITTWVEVTKLDVPGREFSGNVLNAEGKTSIQLGSMSDHIVEKVIPLYTKGVNTFLFRIWKGFIVDVIDHIGG